MSDQLQQWLDGNPIHGEQCVPDFSCCRGIETIAPLEVRQRFVKAVESGDEEAKFEMLGMFLGAAMSGEKIHVAGLGDTGTEQ